ncbi:MAG TPA: DUF397 domain-containing protein [Pseudonocardiaceae bacterium]|nr:DUF397 domain-containing protein [Pseudonocardiaceae bacterium]
MTDKDALAHAKWRKSSFSGSGDIGSGNCVEMAPLADGSIALRHSNQPGGDVVLFTRAEIDAWIKGCKAGEFDDLT